MDDLVEVTLWRVAGIDGAYYATKIQAEYLKAFNAIAKGTT